MGRQSRAHSSRSHKHTDLDAKVRTRDEAFLFTLLNDLVVPPFLLVLDNIQDPHNLGACLRTADAAGVQAVIAPKDRSVRMTKAVRTVACGAAENVPFVQVTGPLAIVMGSEGKGLRRLTAEKCDFLAHLPMTGSVESLNVSVATGICLYEAVRQRSDHTG